MMERAIRVVVTGHVQGVGFRAFVEQEARRHRLAGWVRNRRDGSVEAVFIGESEAVLAMLAECRQGPALANVRDVLVSDYAGPALNRFTPLSTSE
jgi:acylphosphatase